jgi:excisionase family DNA binding protein
MASPRQPLPQLLDIGQLADYLGVTERHVRRLVAERRVPFIKWGRLLRFDPDEIAGWINGKRIEAASPQGHRGAGTRPGLTARP